MWCPFWYELPDWALTSGTAEEQGTRHGPCTEPWLEAWLLILAQPCAATIEHRPGVAGWPAGNSAARHALGWIWIYFLIGELRGLSFPWPPALCLSPVARLVGVVILDLMKRMVCCD